MSTKRNIDLLVNIRRLTKGLLEGTTPEQRRVIPPGFNNNLLWHVGHIMVTQQLLCYKLSGLPMGVDAQELEWFSKGSSPEKWTGDPDDEAIFEKLVLLAEKLRDDVAQQGVFTTYEPYETSTGFVLASIEDAIVFNNFHESFHLGTLRTMARIIG